MALSDQQRQAADLVGQAGIHRRLADEQFAEFERLTRELGVNDELTMIAYRAAAHHRQMYAAVVAEANVRLLVSQIDIMLAGGA